MVATTKKYFLPAEDNGITVTVISLEEVPPPRTKVTVRFKDDSEFINVG